MRKLLALSAFLAACGGSSSHTSSGPVGGTIGGRAFSPVEARALVAGTGATPCTSIPVVGTIGVKAFAIQLTSYANACGDFATGTCSLHKNAQSVTILFAKLNAISPTTEPALAPGTYAISTTPTALTPAGTGVFTVTYAAATATDDTCNGGTPVPASPVAGGTLRIDQVSGPITGHVAVTFANNAGSIEGDFSAPVCTGSPPDICALATSGTWSFCSLPGGCQ